MGVSPDVGASPDMWGQKSAFGLQGPNDPMAPLLTPMLGPGPQARKCLPGPKILIFSKSLQEPLGGSGDPPGAARGCRELRELPGASGSLQGRFPGLEKCRKKSNRG